MVRDKKTFLHRMNNAVIRASVESISILKHHIKNRVASFKEASQSQMCAKMDCMALRDTCWMESHLAISSKEHFIACFHIRNHVDIRCEFVNLSRGNSMCEPQGGPWCTLRYGLASCVKTRFS